MITALSLLAALLSAPASPPTCMSADDPHRWTDEDRSETFRVVRATCESVKASKPVCDALEAVTWRESRGVAWAVHTRGKNELGFGAHGLGWKFWKWTIEGATRKDFCDPRRSTLAVLEIWQRFQAKGALTLLEYQRGYSGRRYTDESRPDKDRRWCSLLRKRVGVDCRREIKPGELGRPIRPDDVRKLAEAVPWTPPDDIR